MVKGFERGLRPVLAAVWLFCFSACAGLGGPEPLDVDVNPALKAQTEEFRQEVIRVTDGVYVAVGYGLANSVLIEGRDGVIIVDTMESAEAAIPVRKEFRKITRKPVKAIIYTHNHADHIFGARVFAEGHDPDVYSHESTLYYIDRILNIVRPTIYRRSMRQFGTLLPKGGRENAGIGPRLMFDRNSTLALIRPNKTFSGDALDLRIAGVRLRLVHAPGETPDQIFVWLPEKKVLLPGDNFYRAFTNVYAIRGTSYRDVTLWVRSLDRMRELRPRFLVPGHSRPIEGEEKIHETLTNYRDAIQFVHDQTIRLMNMGLPPDRIVEQVKLPPHLARQPYLQEYYGTVAWSVRAVYNGYLGWFDGNAANLFPLPPRERAERFARLAGGRDSLLGQAREALSAQDYQWALELADQLLLMDPEMDEARRIKAAACLALGGRQISSNARNYYLTRALELEGRVRIEPVKPKDRDLVHSIPLRAIFDSMAVRLNPQKSAETDMIVGFRFPDTGEAITVHVRRGVAEIQERFPSQPCTALIVESDVWKEIAAGMRSPVMAILKGDIRIEGEVLKLLKFMGLFKGD